MCVETFKKAKAWTLLKGAHSSQGPQMERMGEECRSGYTQELSQQQAREDVAQRVTQLRAGTCGPAAFPVQQRDIAKIVLTFLNFSLPDDSLKMKSILPVVTLKGNQKCTSWAL